MKFVTKMGSLCSKEIAVSFGAILYYCQCNRFIVKGQSREGFLFLHRPGQPNWEFGLNLSH